MRRLLLCVLFFSLLSPAALAQSNEGAPEDAAPLPAEASQDGVQPSSPAAAAAGSAVTPVSKDPFPFQVGFAVKGGPNFSGTTKPDDKVFQGNPADITYPGFFGVGGVVGFFVEPRFFDIVGLEIGLLYEASQGEGDINDFSVTISNTDLVFPLHLRVTIPTPSTPTFAIGLDLVVPLSHEIETAVAFNPSLVSYERDVSTYLGFGLGFEIDAVYVKIPIEIRGRWAAGMEQTYDSRVVLSPVGYKANWELQGQVLVGVKYALEILH